MTLLTPVRDVGFAGMPPRASLRQTGDVCRDTHVQCFDRLPDRLRDGMLSTRRDFDNPDVEKIVLQSTTDFERDDK